MTKISPTVLSFLIFISFSLISLRLQAQLKAEFNLSADSGCTQFADSFTNTTSGGTKPYTFLWDLGNGNHSTSQNANTVYITQGTYRISLYVTDANGKTDSITKTINVLGSPKADYNAIVKYCAVAFFQAAQNIKSPTPIKKYIWVGEGSPGQGPLYKIGRTGYYFYTEGGMYHYTLVLTGSNGCIAQYPDSVYIPPRPQISLPYDTSVCSNTKFTITAYPSGGTPPYKIWWEDQSLNITGPSMTQTILRDTSFLVNVTDSNGCYNYDSTYIKVNPLPSAKWKLNYGGAATYFHAKDSSQTDSSYKWIFGDGDLATGFSTKHIYQRKDDYHVSLFVTGSNGCANKFDSTFNIIDVNIFPNPFISELNIEYVLSYQSDIRIELSDMMGKQIAEITNETQVPGLYKVDINSDKYHLRSGMYLLKFITNNWYAGRNIIKL